MKKEWYYLANRLILPAGNNNEDIKTEKLDALTQKQYEHSILDAIRKERQETYRHSKSFVLTRRRGAATAAA